MSFTYKYPRPALTGDCVIFRRDGPYWATLLIRRSHPPYAGRWAFPGGFVEPGESPLQGARRELEEEAGVSGVRLEQLGAYGDPGRDPRGWVVSVAHWGLCPPGKGRARAGSDAGEARWFALNRLPPLAFDHRKMLKAALGKLKGRGR